jgi:hypothetical protein
MSFDLNVHKTKSLSKYKMVFLLFIFLFVAMYGDKQLLKLHQYDLLQLSLMEQIPLNLIINLKFRSLVKRRHTTVSPTVSP